MNDRPSPGQLKRSSPMRKSVIKSFSPRWITTNFCTLTIIQIAPRNATYAVFYQHISMCFPTKSILATHHSFPQPVRLGPRLYKNELYITLSYERKLPLSTIPRTRAPCVIDRSWSPIFQYDYALALNWIVGHLQLNVVCRIQSLWCLQHSVIGITSATFSCCYDVCNVQSLV